MLTLDEATVRIGRATLLDAVSMQVAPGELVVVVGPNGAGKSTALRVLSGELRPGSGRARIGGEALVELSPGALARRRAVVAQRSELAFDFSVLEVVLLGRHPFNGGHTGPLDRRLAHQALGRVHLESFADRRYPSLSGGERQRVQIARSLVQLAGRPDETVQRYWLLDEPTSALDLAHQHRLMKLCREYAAHGLGVLVVLHDLNLALRYADRVVLIKEGRVHAQGPAEAVLTPPNLEAVYGVRAEVVPVPPSLLPQLVVH